MDNNKKMLLVSAIFISIYLLMNVSLMLFNNSINSSLVDKIILSIALIGDIVFYYYSLSKVDLTKRRLIIFIISLLFFICNIISGIVGFIVFSKTNTYKYRELPKIEIKSSYKWYVYLITFSISMFSIFYLTEYINSKFLFILLYLFLILLNIFVLRKEIITSIKLFKEYFREYNSYVLSMYIKSYIVLIILSLSIRYSTGLTSPTNQSSIESLFDTDLVYIIFSSVILAPLLEELVFRGLIRKFFNKKWLFIIFSGVLFGALHVIDDYASVGELLYILVYSNLGIFLAYTYYETNNICTNIYFHFLQNSLSVLLILLLKFII